MYLARKLLVRPEKWVCSPKDSSHFSFYINCSVRNPLPFTTAFFCLFLTIMATTRTPPPFSHVLSLLPCDSKYSHCKRAALHLEEGGRALPGSHPSALLLEKFHRSCGQKLPCPPASATTYFSVVVSTCRSFFCLIRHYLI